jgi:hypothetical protein
MASRTIHTLAYKMTVDSSQFIKRTITTRQEINHAKREMIAMQTPAEKMEISLARLGKLAEKDARFQELYNKKLAAYQKQLQKTGKQASKFTAIQKRLGSSLFNVRTAMGALAGSAIARTVSNQVAKFDELAKTARQLGTSVEFLTQMQFAAGQQIGFTEDQTVNAFTKMTRRIGEATMGMGEAKSVLDKYGVSIDQFVGKNPEQVFYLLGNAFRHITNEQEQLVIGTKIFDDEQARMFQLMTQNAEATDKLRKRGVELGAAFDSVSAANMEKLADSIGEVNAVFGSFSKEFMFAIAPALTKILGEITTILKELSGGSEQTGPAKTSVITKIGDANAAVVRMIGEKINAVQTGDAKTLFNPRHTFSAFNTYDQFARQRERERVGRLNAQRLQALPEQKTTAKATTQMTKYQKTMTDYMRDMRDYQQQEARRRQFADLR